MAVFRPEIPPHVAEVIRPLPPDLKRGVKQALRALSLYPFAGDSLLRELQGSRKYGVRRFRIIYEVDQRHRVLRVYAVGHRREVYEQVIEQIRRSRSPR
jgi:mRNA interferase RelE/StbE